MSLKQHVKSRELRRSGSAKIDGLSSATTSGFFASSFSSIFLFHRHNMYRYASPFMPSPLPPYQDDNCRPYPTILTLSVVIDCGAKPLAEFALLLMHSYIQVSRTLADCMRSARHGSSMTMDRESSYMCTSLSDRYERGTAKHT